MAARGLRSILRAQVKRLSKSGVVGGAASIVDLILLTVLVQWFSFTPSQANAPALLCGLLIQFLGNRIFVFEATQAKAGPQFIGFLLSEAVAFGLNIACFEWLLRLTVPLHLHYTLVRVLGTFSVYIGFSYPVWHWVFTPDSQRAKLNK